MFADGRTRITLLTVIFITSLMLTFQIRFFRAGQKTRPQLSAANRNRKIILTGHQFFSERCDDNRCQRCHTG
ncbi:hypothetical protein UA45_10585 [Morganella morganii]|uniref:Uncharacterized protein n=1 Tax=Morganella morganii TaxID=582 RepID=A0A0D8L7A9_MORMO|nr:hypothetical protein UA45_10585 [Morganella morganii]